MAEQNDSVNINIGANPAGVEAGSRRAKAAVKSVSDESAGLAAAFRRLQSSIDPTYAAQERYNRSLTENRMLFAAGTISAQEFAAGNRAAAAALEASRSALERNSGEARALAAAQRAARVQEAADARTAAAAVRAAAAEKAAAEKAAAREAATAVREAKAQERAAIAAAAAESKRVAREVAQANKAAAAEEAAALAAAKREETQANREAAAAAKAAAADKREAGRQATTAAREAAEATRRQAIEERGLARSEQELRAAIDPTYAAQLRYNATMQAATNLMMQNKLQAGEFTRIQKNAATQMEINTRSIGRQNTAYTQIGYQMQDVVASFASGINPLVILAQQGGQTASAVQQMGGKFSGVATFMAGPWGAAIFGAVTVLGLLIPQLFSAGKAADAMAASQANLKNYVDATTGSIKDQITATQRLAAAKVEADNAEKQAKQAKKGLEDASNLVRSATRRSPVAYSMASSAAGGGEVTSARSIAYLQKWAGQLDRGSISAEQFARRVRFLGTTDKDVAKLSSRVNGLVAPMQTLQQESQKSAAQQRLFLGTATDADKKLLGYKNTVDGVTQSYLNNQAAATASADAVTRARARQNVAEEDADKVRKKAIASGVPEAKANADYIATVQPYIRATEAASQAKKDASAAAAAGRKQDRADAAAAKAAALEEFRFKVETFDYEREAAVDDYNEQVRIQNLKIEAIRAFHGERSNEIVRAQRELQTMERRHNQTMLELERNRIQAQADLQVAAATRDRDVGKIGVDTAGDTEQAKVETGKYNPRQEVESRRALLAEQYAMEVKFENDVYALKLKALQDQLALLPPLAPARAELNNQIEQLEAQHQTTMAVTAAQNLRDVNKINIDAAAASRAKWQEMTDSVGQSFSQMFQGIWMKTGNFKNDLLNVADQLVFKFVDANLKIAMDWAAGEAQKTAASLFGNSTRTGIEATAAATRTGIKAGETGSVIAMEGAKTGAAVAGQAAQTTAAVAGAGTRTAVGSAAATTELAGRAATSAAGAFSSTVVIPFIGPVAAPVAAAAALAAVMGFGSLIASAAGGQGQVPFDGQITELHKDEMVLPAWIASPLRASLKAPSSSGIIGNTGMAGADARAATHLSSPSGPTFNYQPQHHNMGASMDTLLRKDGAAMRRWMRNQYRNGSLKGE